MITFANEYIRQAKRLLPLQHDLVEIAEELAYNNGDADGKGRDFTPDQIDEATFRASEYLGGMCNTLIAVIEADIKRAVEGGN